MCVESLELLLDKLVKAKKIPLKKVRAISGSAQQCGSVYWRQGANQLLRSLDPLDTLSSQLGCAYSVKDTPVWMDSNSTRQCRNIEEALGGAQALTERTGSRALKRYTGPHIQKLHQTREDVCNSTKRISLISSFMACLLIGDYASIDYTDGAGISLMDRKTHTWMPTALQATAPNLEEKLGELAAPHAVAGKLNSSFIKRYNFSDRCDVIQWSGDNPNSLAVGTHRFFVDNVEEKIVKVHEFNDSTEVRAVVEGQFLAMRAHAKNCGMPPPDRIIASFC